MSSSLSHFLSVYLFIYLCIYLFIYLLKSFCLHICFFFPWQDGFASREQLSWVNDEYFSLLKELRWLLWYLKYINIIMMILLRGSHGRGKIMEIWKLISMPGTVPWKMILLNFIYSSWFSFLKFAQISYSVKKVMEFLTFHWLSEIWSANNLP